MGLKEIWLHKKYPYLCSPETLILHHMRILIQSDEAIIADETLEFKKLMKIMKAICLSY